MIRLDDCCVSQVNRWGMGFGPGPAQPQLVVFWGGIGKDWEGNMQ